MTMWSNALSYYSRSYLTFDLFKTSAGAKPGTQKIATFFISVIAARPPTNVAMIVVFALPVALANKSIRC